MKNPFKILHHGAVDGVTGSCHELRLESGDAFLVDCGLFQGDEVSKNGAAADGLAIEFPIDHVRALVATHAHIDHVGRIPYLLAAGFDGPIYCSQPTATLLPLVIEDALKVGVTRDRRLIEQVLDRLHAQIRSVPYGVWQQLETKNGESAALKLKRAGHILGSAYIEFKLDGNGSGQRDQRVIFSGDLGAPYAPLLPAPKSPYRADVLVLESTYGDRCHGDRRTRYRQIKNVIENALRDRGTVLVPAFSIGRTQELLYEIEGIIYRHRDEFAAKDMAWEDLEIIVDSPLASRFTEIYRELKPYWDAEAHRRLRGGRHPLTFEQLYTVNDHEEHLQTVEYLKETGRPCIVIAASGMCTGGRILNYIEAMIEDPRTDILFVGYQARGTIGRTIQKYGPRHGYVDLPSGRRDIRARIHTISGYSAHADQTNLCNFVKRMRYPPKDIRLVHGDAQAKAALARCLE